MYFGGFVCLILLIWMVVKIWKQSALLAIASIFFWPALIFAFFKYWGDEESDIRLPFLIFVPAAIYVYYDMKQLEKSLREQPESFLWAVQYFA